MNIVRYFNLAIAFTVLIENTAAASEPQDIAHNPFSRPPSEVTMEVRSLVQTDGSVAPLDLRATMVGTKDRLANVGGRILRPGDQVQGYTLLQVFEDKATFEKGSDRLTMYVKPHLVEDEDDEQL